MSENHMEIERKFLIPQLPDNLDTYPHTRIEQGYLAQDPVVRVRRDGDLYYLTYKSTGLMAHEEYNLPLTADSYAHLIRKADGNIISKTRYRIPLDNTAIPAATGSPSSTAPSGEAADIQPHSLTIELDIFDPPFAPLYLAEVEFNTIEDAGHFTVPAWFGQEVTNDPAYHNSVMSQQTPLPIQR